MTETNLELETRYATGLLATTELHAGGALFGVVYRECLRFEAGGTVMRWCEVIDDAHALDDEATDLRETQQTGTWRTEARGNLQCTFPDREFTGRFTEAYRNVVAFHVWVPAVARSHSLVYRARY